MKGSSAGYQLSASLSGSDGASQGQTNTNAQVGAGETLTVKSGQDTTIAGANLGGKDVKMDVGRDLTVASLQDTASSSSSNYSVGATVTVGPAPGFAGSQTGNSGSLGGGSGSSSSAWVSGQTSIIGSNSVDIRTEKNTHVEGAVIAAENGNLKLDTGTLTYKDLQDKDTGSNTQVGVSVPLGGALGTSASTEKPASQPDDAAKPSPVTDFLMGSTLNGSYDSHDKRQVNRATIGEGTITVRSNPDQDLTELNRDPNKSQEITKNSETSVRVYVDPAAIKEVLSGFDGTIAGAKKLLDILDDALANKDTVELALKTYEKLLALNILPKGSVIAKAYFSQLSELEQKQARNSLEEMLASMDDKNKLTALVAKMTEKQRVAVIAAANGGTMGAQEAAVVMNVLFDPGVLSKVMDQVNGPVTAADKDPASYLPRQVQVDEQPSIDRITNALLDSKSALEESIASYQTSSNTNRVESLGNLVSVFAKAMGVNGVQIQLDVAKGGNGYAAVSSTGWEKGPRVTTDNVIRIPVDSPLLTSGDPAMASETIAHELVHILDTAIITNYLKGKDTSVLGARLTAARMVGSIDSNKHFGLYYASPPEAHANFVAKSVVDKLKKAGVLR